MNDVIARTNARHALEMIRAGKMSLKEAEETLLAIAMSGVDLEGVAEEVYGKSWSADPYEDDDPYEDGDW